VIKRGVPSPCMVDGLAPQPLIVKLTRGPPDSLRVKVIDCVTVLEDCEATIASTIWDPPSPMLRVNPRVDPL
jgi:hypothetical protein